jgi:hypothetical protein
MAIQIQFRRGTAAEWSSVNPILAEGEMGIELNTDLFKIGNGVDPWNDLPYGGLRGYAGSAGVAGSVGNIAVENVLYVSKSGNDQNNGSSLNLSKLTIRSALREARLGTTIFVKSGDYTEFNPMYVPEGVAIVGDSLRTVTVRPMNRTEDLFWVNNAVYLTQMTFKDHESPASAVAFPPDGSAGAIHTSPYIQNCTSITTTGTGMRVDGNHVKGLKSMVVDAYTQYNQGGIGVHHLNGGNSQLVSVFTICCDIGFLAESGGFCSITNSNSSFGNYALKADGVSPVLYSAKTVGTQSGGTFVLDGLINKPNIGDAVKFSGDPTFYTVSTATTVTSGSVDIVYPTFSTESASLRNARGLLLDAKTKIQIDTIDYLNETYPDLDYNQFKATRDTGLVIDAVADDIVFGTNYRTQLAGYAYTRQSANNLITNIKTETVDSLIFAKKRSLAVIAENYSKTSLEYTRAEDGFNTVINYVLNGTGAPLQGSSPGQVQGTAGSITASRAAGNLVEIISDVVAKESQAPEQIYPTYIWVDADLQAKFTILQNNKTALRTAVTDWIDLNFPVLIYNRATCQRDIGLVIDAVAYDMMFGSNFKSITAGTSYYRAQAALVLSSQRTATEQAFAYLKTQLVTLVTGNATAVSRIESNMDAIISIINSGLSSVPTLVIPNPTGYDSGFQNARNLIVANKEFIKDEIIAYIEDSYPDFSYDETKCRRDTGIILDGAYYDITLGTNYNAVVNGRSYRRSTASEVTGTQLKQTVGAIRFTKVKTENFLTSSSLASFRSTKYFSEVIDILQNGLTAANELTWTDPGIDANRKYAREQMQINRSFIISTLTSWISTNYPAVNYDVATCERDVGYIIDAISYDIQYGGNSATRLAAESYFEGAISVLPAGEVTATAAAFSELGNILASIVVETYAGQNVTGNPATSAEATAVEDLADLISGVITAGTVSILPTVVYPSTVWVEVSVQTAAGNITQNKQSIINDTIGYINDTFSFTYNQETCKRDIGYIIEALRYDLTYGGNTETLIAAKAYYSYSNLQIPEKDRLVTAAAYRYLKSLVERIALNQIIGSPATLSYVNPTGVSADVANAALSLQANKSFIAAEVAAYIEDNFQSFTYNKTTCARDVGLIVDAISYDLVFGSNFKSIKAGMSYYRAQASTVVGAQKFATLKSFEYLKTLLLAAVANNDLAIVRVRSNMNTILDIIDNGLSVVPDFVIPEPVEYSADFRNARNLIVSNTDFIKAEVLAYITANYPSLVYNQADCQRDIGYIIDALRYDLTYGGNTESVIAGLAYYSGVVLQIPSGEKAATLAAYGYLKTLVELIAEDQEISALQGVETQIRGTGSNNVTALAAGSLVGTIINIIDDVNTAPMPTQPSITWTPSALQTLFASLQSSKGTIEIAVTDWIDDNFVDFTYNESVCLRDVGLILDAVTYDLLYGGNSQTADAADEYYSGGILQIPGETIQTSQSFRYVKDLAGQIVVNAAINPLQNVVTQNTANPPATLAETTRVGDLVEIVANIVENAYTSTITLEENAGIILDNTTVTFHQFSLITSSGHTFEWIGAGTNVNTALPYLGGTPVTENQVIETNGGKVYFTGTDQRGDFRIGNDLVINRNTGTISGRTFNRSLFAVMTPYILAIGE